MSFLSRISYFFPTVVLAILFNDNRSILLLLFFVFYLIFIFFRLKNKALTVLNLLIFLLIIPLSFHRKNDLDEGVEKEFYLHIYEKKENYILARDESNNFLIYNIEVNKNDYIKLNGKVEAIKANPIFNIFDFKEYLYYKRVYYQINKIENLQILKQSKFNNQILIEKILSLKGNSSKKILSLLLFSYRSDDNLLFRNNLIEISAIHLFTISGFHINILFFLILKILLLFFRPRLANFLGMSILIPYLWIVDFPMSATRAFLSLLCLQLLSKKVGSLNRLTIVAFIFIILDPLVIFQSSFVLIFLTTFILDVTKNINTKNFLLKAFKINLAIFISLIPINVLFSYQINLVSIISNVLLIYPTIILFFAGLANVLFIFPDVLYNQLSLGFLNLISLVKDLSIIVIFPKPDLFFFMAFYMSLISFFVFWQTRSKRSANKFFLLLCLAITWQYNRFAFIEGYTITFIDVGQGDSVLIRDLRRSNTLLIDTGGSSSYDIATSRLIPYFKSSGIRRIDKLVITHNHFDHYGALDSLQSNFPVGEIIKEKVNVINFGEITLKNLNQFQDSLEHENNKSIVLFTRIYGFSYLFAGDAERELEGKIISNYEKENIDFLKVGHHGSNTSTNEEFLHHFSISNAVISVGQNNIYGHPHPEVLERLNNYNIAIYRTDLDGSVRIHQKRNSYSITTVF